MSSDSLAALSETRSPPASNKNTFFEAALSYILQLKNVKLVTNILETLDAGKLVGSSGTVLESPPHEILMNSIGFACILLYWTSSNTICVFCYF